MKVAIFDFDGTIYKYETFTLMMEFAKHHPTYGAKYKSFYYSIIPPYVGYKMKIYPEAKMKRNVTQKYLQLFHGQPISEVESFFQQLADNMRNDFHPLVIERIEKHKQQNDTILVVSGAFTPLLQATLAHLPIDYIIGTAIPTKGQFVDATTPIDHIQSERKTALILETLKHNVIDWQNCFAYGDSIADLPVLEMVGNPVAVCPDVKLQHIANTKDWTIVC